MARHGKAAHNRKKNVKRQPDGRPTQSAKARLEYSAAITAETEQEAIATAVAARLRAGIPEHLARVVGTVEGALFAAHEINRDQYDAACWYIAARHDAYAANDNPHRPKLPRTPGKGSEDPEAAYVNFCASALERWQRIRDGVRDAQTAIGNTANLFGALDGLERLSIEPHQIGGLRLALNAVNKVRISGTRKRLDS